MKIFAQFAKVDEDQRIVEGYASTEAVDSQGEVVTRQAISGALADYMKFANVREMHQPSAVGKTKQAVLDDQGLRISVKVVDDTAWQKIKEGVYNGFSIGGVATVMNGNRIEGLSLHEISLVDRPACPEAVFTLFKLDEGKTMSDATTTPAKALTKADVQAGYQLLSEAFLAKSCGIYNAANLASVLEQLAWVTSDSEWEKQYEGDESKVPEMLRQGYATLAEALKAMVAEETSEASDELKEQAAAGAADDPMVVVEMAAKPEGEAAVVKSDDAAASAEADPGAAPGAPDAATVVAQVPSLTDEQKNALRVVWQLIESAGLAAVAQSKDGEDGSKPKADEASAAAAEGDAPGEGEKKDPPAQDDEDKEKAALVTMFKAAGFDTAKDALAAISKAQKTIEDLTSQVKELSERPALTKGVLRVIGRDGNVEALPQTTIEAIEKGESARSVLSKMFSGELSAPAIGTPKVTKTD